MNSCEKIEEIEISVKAISGSRSSLWKAFAWIVVAFGLSFFAANQLVGQVDMGTYEEGTTFHESPGLLGALSSAFGLSSTTRERRQEDDPYWNDRDNQDADDGLWNNPNADDDFWNDIFKSFDDDSEDFTRQWQNTDISPTQSRSTSTVHPTFTTEIWEDSTSSAQVAPTITTAVKDTSTTTNIGELQTTNQPNSITSQATTADMKETTEEATEWSKPWWFVEETTPTTESQTNLATDPSVKSTGKPLDEEGPCYPFSYDIGRVCEMTEKQASLFGPIISIEDVSALIFDSLVIDKLMSECSNGTWCLGTSMDRAMFEDVDHSILELCPITDCLLDVPDVCISEVCIT